MEKPVSNILGTVIAVLAAYGFVGSRHFLGLLNTDPAHSVIRVPVTLALLYGGSQANLRTTRKILTGVSAIYLIIGTAGLIDKRAGGLLPSKLTNFDLAYHFTVGTAMLWLGTRPGRMMKPEPTASARS